MIRRVYTLIITLFFFLLSTNNFAQTQKVMSFNIRIDVPSDGENIWNNRKEGLRNLINYYEPGIIGFQEVFGSQRNYLDSVLTNYMSIGMGRDGNFDSEAIPIYFDSMKYKVLAHGTFWLSESQDTASYGWDAAYPRICTYAMFGDNKTGKEFWVFNTHLDNKGEIAKQEGAKLILRKIEQLTKSDESVIVMGDLNSTPESKPVEIFKSKLSYAADISEKGLYGPLGTHNGFNNNIVLSYWIDYIFTSNIKVYSYAHIDDMLPNNNCVSDHLPVLMKFTMP